MAINGHAVFSDRNNVDINLSGHVVFQVTNLNSKPSLSKMNKDFEMVQAEESDSPKVRINISMLQR